MPAICHSQITSAQSGAWSAASTWQAGHVPVRGDDVVVRQGDSVFLDISTPLLNTFRSDGTLDGGKDTIFLRKEISGHVIFDSGCVRYLDSLPISLGAMSGTYFDLKLDSVGLKLSGDVRVQHDFTALFTNSTSISGSGQLSLQGSLLYRGASCTNWAGTIHLIGKRDSVRHDTLVAFSAGLNGNRLAGSFQLPKIMIAKPDSTYYVRVGHDSASVDSLFLDGKGADTIVDVQSGTLDIPANMIALQSASTKPLIRIANGAKLRTNAEFPIAGIFDSLHLPLIACDSGSVFEYYSRSLALIDIAYLYNNIVNHRYDGLELSNVVATCYSNPLIVRRRLELQYGASFIPAQVARGEQGNTTQYLHTEGDVVNLNQGESGSQGAGLRGCGMVSTGSDKWIFDRGNQSGKDTCNWSGPSMVGSAIIDSNTVLSVRFINDASCDSLDFVDSLIEKGSPCGGHLIGRVYKDQSPEFSASHMSDDYSGLGLAIITGTNPYLGKTKIVRTSGYPVPGANLLPSSVRRYYNIVPSLGPQNGQLNHIVFQYHCDEAAQTNPEALHFWRSVDDGHTWSFSGRSSFDPISHTYAWDTIAVAYPDTSNAFLWTLSGGYQDIPTPVELQSFTAVTRGSAVDLSWITGSETALRGFEIIRHSGSRDTTIASYSTNPDLLSHFPEGGSYQAKDVLSFAGQYRYDLIEVTANGIRQKLSTQTITQTNIGPWSELQIMIRQAGQRGISILIGSPVTDRIQFTVYDVLGREVGNSPSIEAIAGATPVELRIPTTPGVYYLSATGSSSRQMIKFVVKTF